MGGQCIGGSLLAAFLALQAELRWLGNSDATELLIILQCELWGAAVARHCNSPQAHEHMLNERQLIGVASQIIEQSRDQSRLHPAAKNSCRSFYYLLALLACKPRRQVLSIIDRLRETNEL